MAKGKDAKPQAKPEAETKADKFRRLGKKRYVMAVERLRMISHLANRATYEYTDAQVDELLTKLNDEVNEIEAAFEAAKQGGKDQIDIDL